MSPPLPPRKNLEVWQLPEWLSSVTYIVTYTALPRSRGQIGGTGVITSSWIEHYYLSAFCGGCPLASSPGFSHGLFSILRSLEIKVRFILASEPLNYSRVFELQQELFRHSELFGWMSGEILLSLFSPCISTLFPTSE